ncbi:hypothetical protein [uncultured Desulfuromusa sp.]|uniref:hypothetical protein n=1 Tax=uncultured Desulfuromusa sp. TaxID=219183 RepID=UPI002AA6AC31|nr:hypothetical protein [uncultured Desulfuromusa sp.]
MTQDDRQFMQQLFETQAQQFQRHMSAISENFDHKIGLIAEGHESLNQKIDGLTRKTNKRFDLMGFKIDTLNHKIDSVDEKLSHKIDGVAADLKAHRADTEAHHGVYRVKEG